MHRYVDENKLLQRLRREAVGAGVNDTAATACATRLREWLERHPEHPDLVGSKVAAQILGVQQPHITRLKKHGRLRPIPIEGAFDVYVREEVEHLAREIADARARRARASAGR